MAVFKNVRKEAFVALAEVSYSHKVNGEKSIKGTIYTGDEVISGIDRGWSLEFKGEVFYITYALPVDNGESVTVEFDAIHEFFYKMGKSSVYELLNGSNTAKTYLDLIFSNSGYNYSLSASLPAFEKQNFGMKNRLALFNDFINSTSTEFKVVGKTVTIVEKLGSDLSTIVRKGFNMQELGLEQNIGDFVTYAKGFGAFVDPDDESKGRLEATYKSPLADIYGILESDPVVDERYTKTESMLVRLKELVESSYSISISLTVEDLQKAGYNYAFPNPGDYISAINEELHFQQKIRIVGIEESFDVLGESLEKSVVCNSLNLVDQKNQADASNSQNWSDIMNGVKPIPNEWLTDAIRNATNALLEAQTEVSFTNNGILAVEKEDSNRLVLMNSAGIGVSTDGGKTFENALTAQGVNASVVNTGILRAIKIQGKNIMIDLTSGEVSFKQGEIIGKDLKIDITNGEMKTVQKANQGTTTVDYSNAQIRFRDNRSNKEAAITGWGVGQENSAEYIPALQLGAHKTLRLFLYYDPSKEARLTDRGWFVSSTSALYDLSDSFSINAPRFSVTGTKNAIHPTREGVRATPAYETTESYLGDIGRSVTNTDCEVWVSIDPIFSDTVNLDSPYEVFLQVYNNARVWVSDFRSDAFLVCSDQPRVRFAYELKAKRMGYENERLVLFEEIDNKETEQIWGPQEFKEKVKEVSN